LQLVSVWPLKKYRISVVMCSSLTAGGSSSMPIFFLVLVFVALILWIAD
jgi:hypothetical protein